MVVRLYQLQNNPRVCSEFEAVKCISFPTSFSLKKKNNSLVALLFDFSLLFSFSQASNTQQFSEFSANEYQQC